MFDSQTHHHTTIPEGTLDRIEKAMVDAARKEAISVVERERHNGVAGSAAGQTLGAGYVGVAANPNKSFVAPRLEPFHYEVKLAMTDCKLTEKQAERHVRKALLESAVWQISDPAARMLAQGLLALT